MVWNHSVGCFDYISYCSYLDVDCCSSVGCCSFDYPCIDVAGCPCSSIDFGCIVGFGFRVVVVTVVDYPCCCNFNFDFNHACCLEPLFDVFKISLVIVHPSYCFSQVSIRLMNCFFRCHHSYQNHYSVRILDLETNHNLEYLPLERPYQLSHPSPNFNLDQNLAYLLNHPFDSRKGKDYQPTSSSLALRQ